MQLIERDDIENLFQIDTVHAIDLAVPNIRPLNATARDSLVEAQDHVSRDADVIALDQHGRAGPRRRIGLRKSHTLRVDQDAGQSRAAV